jgi:4-hydroxy-4-methyl-2-oxoglutarate aldolase
MTTQIAALSRDDFERLAQLDTCTVSNAIERFNLRMRNEGFAHGCVHCQFPHFPPLLGYAVTGRIRASAPPMSGRCYYDRMDWWNHFLTVPEPRVMVLEDVDHVRGIGAFVGEIHANIARALNCIGCVTDGAVRDLSAVESLGFHLFAGKVAVSHAYAHIVEFGEPVEIGGLKVQPGDLIHGDRHGVQTIPLSIAAGIPGMASEILARERELIKLCQSPEFSLSTLGDKLQEVACVPDGTGKRENKIHI